MEQQAADPRMSGAEIERSSLPDVRAALTEMIVRAENEKGRADRLQARLYRIAQFCADETVGVWPAHDGLLARIAEMAEGRL